MGYKIYFYCQKFLLYLTNQYHKNIEILLIYYHFDYLIVSTILIVQSLLIQHVLLYVPYVFHHHVQNTFVESLVFLSLRPNDSYQILLLFRMLINDGMYICLIFAQNLRLIVNMNFLVVFLEYNRPLNKLKLNFLS